MIGDKYKFFHLEDYDGGFMKFGDNSGIHIRGKGTLLLKNDIPIHDVYYVEGLKHNLLSVSQICDNGYNVSFNSQSCVIKSSFGKTVATRFSIVGNIYNLTLLNLNFF